MSTENALLVTWPYCLNAKSGRSTRCYKRLNSARRLIQRTTSEAPERHYVLHRTGCSQEDDQLLREGRGWPCAPRGQDRINAPRTGRLDSEHAAAPYDRHGSDDLYRVDL